MRLSAELVLVVALATWTAGCGRTADDGGAAWSRDEALRAVSLPNLSGIDPSLADRLRSAYASLDARRQRPSTDPLELARAFGELGKLLMAAEYLHEAEPYFVNAQVLAPADMRWPYFLGHVYRLRQEPEPSVSAFERALQLSGEHVPTLIWLGTAYIDQGRPEAAEPLFTRAAALAPRSAAALFGLGRVALARNDHASAVRHLEAALAADPRAAAIHYSLAGAYRGLGQAKLADAHLRQWKDGEVAPADPLLEELATLLQTARDHEVRGTRALDDRRFGEAAAHFRRGLELAPNEASLHLNLGTALALAGDDRGAIEQFEEAIRLSPTFARAHFTLGLMMAARGRDHEAIERFSAAVKHDPGLVDARFSLAEALRRTGRPEAALGHYETIFDADSSASQARFGHAMALVRLRRYAEARSALETAATLHPDQPGFAHALARVLAAAPDDAVRDGQRAFTTVQELLRAHSTSALSETMAMVAAELGRYGEAVRWQRDAMARAASEGRTEAIARLRENLSLYEREMPCRTPWRDDDPVHLPPAQALAN